MSEQNISQNLQTLLKLRGDITLSDLARETGVPQPTLHHIVEGRTKKPRRQALESLATYFSISVPQLIGTLPLLPNIPNAIKDSLKISTVPLIDWELAKNWNRDDYECIQFREIIVEREVSKNTFALELQDASMEPLFLEKSILIFDPTKSPKGRDFVLVYLAQSNSVTFNRLFIEDNKFYLRQEQANGDVDLRKLNISKDRIIATLIQARLEF